MDSFQYLWLNNSKHANGCLRLYCVGFVTSSSGLTWCFSADWQTTYLFYESSWTGICPVYYISAELPAQINSMESHDHINLTHIKLSPRPRADITAGRIDDWWVCAGLCRPPTVNTSIIRCLRSARGIVSASVIDSTKPVLLICLAHRRNRDLWETFASCFTTRPVCPPSLTFSCHSLTLFGRPPTTRENSVHSAVLKRIQ